MKKLFAQIVKFGIVGFISFGIDYVTGLIVLNLVMALTSSSILKWHRLSVLLPDLLCPSSLITF